MNSKEERSTPQIAGSSADSPERLPALPGFVPDLVDEFRSLLAPMTNAVELLRLHGADDPELAPGIAILDRQLGGIGRLLERLSLAGQLQRPDAAAVRAPFELHTLLAELPAHYRAARTAPGPELELIAPARPLACDASARLLSCALRAMLEEMSAANPVARALRLEVGREGDGLAFRIRVVDNGGDARRPAPASTVRGTARRLGRELGLGLAARVAELHGGRLETARFPAGCTLLLPRCATSGTTPSGPGTTGAVTRRVLVVDDNDAMQDSLTGILAELGQQVRSARDGEEALRIARDWRPDLVLLDINLPKLNGYRVARELRSEFPPAEMAMVMMTGDYPVEAVRRGAAEAGVARCIDKMQAGALIRELLAGATG